MALIAVFKKYAYGKHMATSENTLELTEKTFRLIRREGLHTILSIKTLGQIIVANLLFCPYYKGLPGSMSFLTGSVKSRLLLAFAAWP